MTKMITKSDHENRSQKSITKTYDKDSSTQDVKFYFELYIYILYTKCTLVKYTDLLYEVALDRMKYCPIRSGLWHSTKFWPEKLTIILLFVIQRSWSTRVVHPTMHAGTGCRARRASVGVARGPWPPIVYSVFSLIIDCSETLLSFQKYLPTKSRCVYTQWSWKTRQ